MLSINHLPPACWSTFWKSNFKQQLGCRFDIMDSISFFLYFDICNYICLDTSYHFLALSFLYFFKNSCTNIFHRRSLCTFYTLKYLNIFTKINPRTSCVHLEDAFEIMTCCVLSLCVVTFDKLSQEIEICVSMLSLRQEPLLI